MNRLEALTSVNLLDKILIKLKGISLFDEPGEALDSLDDLIDELELEHGRLNAVLEKLSERIIQ